MSLCESLVTLHHYRFTGSTIAIQPLTGVSSTDITSGQFRRIIMAKIPKNTFSPGATYKVSLAATAGSSISQGSAMQRIGMLPRHGSLQVTPTQGIAYNTTFRARALGWIDRSSLQPFQYRFGYKDPSSSNQLYLTTWRNLDVLSRVVLPAGDGSDEQKLTVFTL